MSDTTALGFLMTACVCTSHSPMELSKEGEHKQQRSAPRLQKNLHDHRIIE
jgi:hypothetical protein